MPSTPHAPAFDRTFSQASDSVRSDATLSIRLNHLPPFTPLARAISIFSLQMPRSALWRCHRSSLPCLSGFAGTDGSLLSLPLSFEAFTFLPPFAPSALPDFSAPTAALTAARRSGSSPCVLSVQLSPLRHTPFATFPLQPHPSASKSPIPGSSRLLDSRFAQASPLASRLAADTCRIEFTFVWDCSFASGCSPPRLAATQLPSASPPLSGSVAFRLSLTGLYVFMITLASGLRPMTPGRTSFRFRGHPAKAGMLRGRILESV
jgi:hypothetical protein